jgi:hypothetical protein
MCLSHDEGHAGEADVCDAVEGEEGWDEDIPESGVPGCGEGYEDSSSEEEDDENA